ncbi:lactonase family protein [Aliterella atlantica]|uniref:Uncharacterized protein n=1 Tax=Aliterella atlantica CENA595 TaxID=1618023 RepID=A0A0D8ZR21_9CYAN|nr:lactonase family protein [Aliterella atlantica]KJH70792.1 hypothetical protein UH38_16330 [Aliterella atlantica CENA595]
MKLLKSKGVRRFLGMIGGFVFAILGFGLLQLIEPIAIAPAQATLTQFSGRTLLIASDADMVATAYADAKLDRVAGIEDTLSIVPLPLNVQNPQLSKVRVSNSVMSFPHILAVSPNGSKAYVAEVRSRPVDSIEQFNTIDQMPEGKIISVVDIANPTQPKVMQTLKVGKNPAHISLSPDGQFLAINLAEKGKELAIAPIQPDGKLAAPTYFALNFPGSANSAVTWHPSGKFLAFTTAYDRDAGGAFIAFYQVQRKRDIEIQPYGNPIGVGNHFTMGKFTPDGKFLLVPDLKWRVYGQRQLNFLMNPQGELLAIQLDEQTRQPQVVSRLKVGLSPEGLAISPDGTLAATVNMRRTYLPNWLPAWRGRDRNSLSLVQIEPQSGQLSAIAEYGFEGLLPEDAIFDADGKSLAVVIYNERISSPKTGKVEFWNVVQQPEPKLERTRFNLEVVRGPHNLAIAR